MKKNLLQLVIALLCCSTYAQFGPQNIISSTASGASTVIPYDVNNDGFMDVFSNADNRFG